jgi:hypothetical protein
MSGNRGDHAGVERKMTDVGLPPRPFLYTIDQICTLIDIEEPALKASHVYYEGRSVGIPHKHLMVARNIAAPDEKPDWRVAERELIRWFKRKGFKWYDRGYPTH